MSAGTRLQRRGECRDHPDGDGGRGALSGSDDCRGVEPDECEVSATRGPKHQPRVRSCSLFAVATVSSSLSPASGFRTAAAVAHPISPSFSQTKHRTACSQGGGMAAARVCGAKAYRAIM